MPRSCGLPGPSWVERATGIEPAPSVWKTEALPLSYARERPTTAGRADSVPNPVGAAKRIPRARRRPSRSTPLRRGGAFPGPRTQPLPRTGGPAAARRRPGGGPPTAAPRPGHPRGGPDGIHSSSPRGVAQLGSALALGARGRGFKSRHPDCRSRPDRPGNRRFFPRGARALPMPSAGSPTLDARNHAPESTPRSVKEYACEEHRRDSEPDARAARHRGAVRRARAEPQEGVPGDRPAGPGSRLPPGQGPQRGDRPAGGPGRPSSTRRSRRPSRRTSSPRSGSTT